MEVESAVVVDVVGLGLLQVFVAVTGAGVMMT